MSPRGQRQDKCCTTSEYESQISLEGSTPNKAEQALVKLAVAVYSPVVCSNFDFAPCFATKTKEKRSEKRCVTSMAGEGTTPKN